MNYKYLIYKDIKRRIKVLKLEKNRNWLKSLITNFYLNYNIRIIARKRLIKIKKDYTRTRIKNRCTITGNPKSVYRQFKMCRSQLKAFCRKRFF